MSNAHNYSLAAVRYVTLDGRKWLSLEDALLAFGFTTTRMDAAAAAVLGPDYFRLHPLMGDSGEPVVEGVLTIEGLAKFMLASKQPERLEVVDTLVAAAFEEMVAPRRPKRAVAARPDGTRWGVQPFRTLMRTDFPSLTVPEVVELMNLHRAADEKAITKASFDAVAIGRQLPSISFLRCLGKVLQKPHSVLLTEDAFAAFNRKYPPVPSVAPSEPVRTLSPVLDYDPDVLPDPENPDEAMARFFAQSDALMEQAAAEAIGMPGVPFEAGFAAVMGSPAPLDAPDPFDGTAPDQQ